MYQARDRYSGAATPITELFAPVTRASAGTGRQRSLTEYLRQMEPLERLILDRLAKVKEVQETNINLNVIWRECGGVEPADFVQAWGNLDAEELVHGEIYSGAESIEGLGKITAKGEEALRG
ncbi:MAG: hypothetical protein JOZ31_18255 [Verrucomicrobia bacterium]|nr:hypothetical protein [Verrucomicrobiota bacterium]